MSVGGGWAKFVIDNKLSMGAFLTFEVVDERRLVVAHHTRCTAEDGEGPHQPDINSATVREWRYIEPPEAEHPHRLATMPNTDVQSNTLQRFRKTLRKTHVAKQNNSRIVSVHCVCW